MASREKDSADFDLESFVDLFDVALTSSDERVKTALSRLLTITALVSSQNPRRAEFDGPMRRLFEDVKNISRRVERLELRGYTDQVDGGAKQKTASAQTFPRVAARSLLPSQDNSLSSGIVNSETLIKNPSYKGSSIGPESC